MENPYRLAVFSFLTPLLLHSGALYYTENAYRVVVFVFLTPPSAPRPA
jgi:hypothetical protein